MIRALLLTALAGALLLGAARADDSGSLESGPLAFDSLPGHAHTVVLALAGRLRGGDAASIAATLRVEGSALVRPERGFRYRSFGLHEVVLRGLSGDAGSGTAWRIAGEILWRDLVGRRAISAFDADYRLEASGPRLTRVAWRPVFAALPDVRVFAVPPSRAEALEPAAKQGFARFIDATAESSVAGTPEGDEGLIFSFFLMDRLGPDSHCEPRLSDQETGTEGKGGIARARAYEPGWFVAGVPLTRAALDSDGSLWLKLVCWEGEGSFFSRPEEHLVTALRVNGG